MSEIENIVLLDGLGETLKIIYANIPGWKYFNIRLSNDKYANRTYELYIKKDNEVKILILDEECRLSLDDLQNIVKLRELDNQLNDETKGVKNIDISYYKDDHHDNYKVYIENKVTKEQYIWMIVYSEFDAKSWTKEIKALLEVYEEKFRGM